MLWRFHCTEQIRIKNKDFALNQSGDSSHHTARTGVREQFRFPEGAPELVHWEVPSIKTEMEECGKCIKPVRVLH